MWRKEQNLEVGDLVYHVLYGRTWIGIVLQVDLREKGLSKASALVHMIPGTEYSSHFQKAFSKPVGIYRGWIASKWLVPHNIKKKK